MNKITIQSLILNAAVILMSLIILPNSLSAKELEFKLSASRNVVSLGQSIQLSLEFNDTRDIPALDLPEIDGFNSRYVGPSTRMSFVNGRMSSSITHSYKLVPLKTGKITIGPFSFKHDGDTYVSNQISIEVVDTARGQHYTPPKQSERDLIPEDRLFLTMEAGKSKVYMNEIVPLTIKLYVSGISVRDIQYPEFSHEGFSAEQFDKPKQYQVRKGNTVFDVVEFTTSIFGTKSGEFSLGPATLQANIILKRKSGIGRDPFDDFFGRQRTEPIKLNSGPMTVHVLTLPKEGRPSGFRGAIGNFDFNVNISPMQVKTGDPLTMKMTVTGKGNLNTVTAPALNNINNFKTYEPQVRQDGNRKTFEQILIPLDDSVIEIPEATFSFFNSDTGKYHTIVKGPFKITVTKPDKKEEITIMDAPRITEMPLKKEVFGRDIIYIKESPGSLKQKGGHLYRNILFILLNTVPPLIFIGAWTIMKRKERISTDVGYARRLVAPKKAKKGIRNSERYLQKNRTLEFYNSVFKTMREYIGDRFHIPSGGITSDIVDETLKEKNISGDILSKINTILRECDMARYAPAELSATDMDVTLRNLKEVIDYMERQK